MERTPLKFEQHALEDAAGREVAGFAVNFVQMRSSRHFAAAPLRIWSGVLFPGLMMLSLVRRAMTVLSVGLMLSACASVGPSIVPRSVTTPPQLTQASILTAINAARQSNGGHKAWTYNAQLEAACETQLGLMVEKDKLEHNLGLTPRQRTDQQGYRGAIGENLAGGQRTLEQAIEGWLNSPGHRATLLSDKFAEFGLAVASVPAERNSRYGIYWCMIAGGPVSAWMPS